MEAERPHVAHVIDELPPDGAERLIVDVLQNRSARFRYSVVCIVRGGDLVREVEATGVPVHILHRPPGLNPGTVAALIRWFRRNRVSVVHTHLHAADTYGRLAAWLSGVPARFSTRHSAKAWTGVGRPALAWSLSWLSTKVIACGTEVGLFMQQSEHIPTSKIVVVPNGINLRRFDHADRLAFRRELGIGGDTLLVGAVGRLLPVKGHAELLEAVGALARDGVDVHCAIVGSGELEQQLRATASRLGIGERAHFTGQRADIPNILAALDIFAMPSQWEGLPMALLEAMALARPVVATAVGSIPEVVVDGQTGRLVPAGDRSALTEALRELAATPAFRARLGTSARRLVEQRFNAALTAEAYEDLYTHALHLA